MCRSASSQGVRFIVEEAAARKNVTKKKKKNNSKREHAQASQGEMKNPIRASKDVEREDAGRWSAKARVSLRAVEQRRSLPSTCLPQPPSNDAPL